MINLENFRVITLSKLLCSKNIDTLCSLGKDLEWDNWTPTEFSMELNNKWKLSFIVYCEQEIVAYAIMSEKDINKVHIHRFIVHKDYRKVGLSNFMIKEVIKRAEYAEKINLKVHCNNQNAIKFYKNHGFKNVIENNSYLMMEKYI